MSQNANSTSSVVEKGIGYSSEAELISELKDCLGSSSRKDFAANYLYQSLLDEMILGFVLKVHRAWRFGLLDNDYEEEPENHTPNSGENYSVFNSFDQNPRVKKMLECQCICTRCERTLGASEFQRHLEVCMGVRGSRRQASKLANERLAARDNENRAGDDEDIAKRRKRNNTNVRSSNGKKNGKMS